jgi:FPC/CPF motif-containing protein YcgG
MFLSLIIIFTASEQEKEIKDVVSLLWQKERGLLQIFLDIPS